ncbi:MULTISPECIES: hypothetical protein [unclassified Nostoc]|uniref:hypothetical protein n=1 Tax=unclassified Nostoc TaxID=2593658 RepID=UPI002AD3EA84|nr:MULTISPECIES: hypothetical protein [unclassified Nostoc]MDZ8123992.1 hypothetical protein [Nostoc sp. CmiVER01]MDZ8225504.1 hypothetical protein [Nostoc sp. ChiVER01]
MVIPIHNGLRPATLTQWATLGDAKSERPAMLTQLKNLDTAMLSRFTSVSDFSLNDITRTEREQAMSTTSYAYA